MPTACCLQVAAFAAEHGHGDSHIIIGGDFNTLWRKYSSDRFDQVSCQRRRLTDEVQTAALVTR